MSPRVWGTTTMVSDRLARKCGVNTTHYQVRAIFLGTQKAFAAAIGEPVSWVSRHGSPTGNAEELAMAAKYPSVALVHHSYHDSPWFRLDTEEEVR